MFKRWTLKKEIVCITCVKLILLYLLWSYCFSHPVDKKQLPSKITSHLLSEPR